METKNQFISAVISTQILTENHSLGTAQNQGCEESYMTLESKKHVKIYHLNKKKKKKKIQTLQIFQISICTRRYIKKLLNLQLVLS